MIITLLMAGLLVFQALPSDTTNTDDISVDKALEIAYQHNTRIKQLENRIEAQEQQKTLNLGIRDPQVTYAKEGIGQGTFTEQRWVISQTMDFPLSGYYKYQSAAATVKSLKKKLESQKLQLKADVKKAYTKLAFAIESSHLEMERVELFQDLKNAADTRAEMGESSAIDAMQASLQLSEAQNSMQQAEQGIMNARYNLFEIIGLEEDQQTYDISFPDTLKYVGVEINQDDILRKLQDHPQLQQLQKNRLSASYMTKAAKSSYLPDLTIQYYRQDFGNGFDFDAFEIGFSIPLWFGLNQTKQVQQSKARYRVTQWQLQEQQLVLKKQAEQAWHGYETAKSNIKRFRNSVQAKSRQLLSMTQKGYQLGELDLLRLLEAQRTYLRTQQAYYQTLQVYYMRVIELEKFLQTDIIFK